MSPRERQKGMAANDRLDELPQHFRELVLADARRRLADAPDPTDESATRLSRLIQRFEATSSEASATVRQPWPMPRSALDVTIHDAHSEREEAVGGDNQTPTQHSHA